jgi:hypothetical protein
MAVRIRIARVTLSLRTRGASPRLALPRELRRFAARRGEDIRLEVAEAHPPAVRPASLLFDSGGLWRVYRHSRGLLYVFREPVRAAPAYKALLVDNDWRTGVLYVPPGIGSYAKRPLLDYPLDELLFQHHVARWGGMEVHACAVVVGREAVLLCGASGAGKTTMARLFKKHRPATLVLSDDRIIVRPRGGRLWAHGTPWHGSARFASPEGRPLAAIFFLAQSARPSVHPLEPAAAATRLFPCSFPPPWDAPSIGRVLELCGRAAAAVPCAVLRFRRGASAVSSVIEALKRGSKAGQ